MLEKYPYLTEIYNKKFETKTICLIQSVSKNYISFYNLQELKPMDIEKFFRLAGGKILLTFLFLFIIKIFLNNLNIANNTSLIMIIL